MNGVKSPFSIAALCVLCLAAACAPGERGNPSPSQEPAPSEVDPSQPAPEPPAPLDRGTTEIYFPSAAGDGLVGAYSDVFVTVAPEDRIKQIVNDLIAGPSTRDALGALPPGTELRQAYVLPDGTAYLDFNAGLKGIGGGSLEELLVVYSIVNSVAHNVAEVRRVGILVDGQVVESLNGHMDLRRPLAPDYSWILVPAIVQAVPAPELPVAAAAAAAE